MKFIHTNKAPKAIGSYSQAVKIDNLVFCSGQIGIDPKTNELVSGITAQTQQVLKNLNEVLVSTGVKKEQVVKTTIYLANINDYPVVNEIYAKFFGSHKPARATVAVNSLPKGALVEIEVVAYR